MWMFLFLACYNSNHSYSNIVVTVDYSQVEAVWYPSNSKVN